ncbi:hypothetical protein BLNAU_11374 [Blattamonas nauphoetae]|uniref:Protein kinase domain-containing protein n=1 Tax=Blattamonas nauphoetae TaxID=2049346 RepID=A0ABQ9XMM9_9EUKA|nr:hypothetical protein BLNAU_11374 [Blattamonas nauphoetae]
MNTTSTPSKVKVAELERMELTQRVTGSRVRSSTNHLYGTACADMNANVMGSHLSLNTSFSSCLTDTPTHLGQHFTDRQELPQSAFFKLCTFKGCSSESDGGAIYLDDQGSLRIEDCSFQTCRASSHGCGGAIYYMASEGATFIVTSSLFVGSSCEMGGTLCLRTAQSASLLNCVFIDSVSRAWGGCMYSFQWDALLTSSSITNCHFENCRTTSTDSQGSFSGGALYFLMPSTIQFNFVNFRGNQAAQNPGNDIMFAGKTPLITSETMVGCTSTSDSPRLRVYGQEGTDDHLPNPTSVTHVSWEPTAVDSDTAEFTLKMSETITGTVLVQIDNSDGTRAPTGDEAPNIGRVLIFSFDNIDESSCRVPLGESGLVQEPLSEYQVIRSSFVGSIVLSADYVLDENKENVLITISGSGIPSGILSVTLSDNTVLEFEFESHQTISKVLTVPLTENSPKLGYGETYSIVSAQSQAQPSRTIIVPFIIKMIVPNPPRLTTLNEPEYDDALKTVSIGLEGVNLEGTHKVTLSVNGTDETVTIDVVFSSSKGQLGGILVDSEAPSNVNMALNTRYVIVEMKKNDVNVLCLGDLSFTTMAEPIGVSLVSRTPNSINTFIRVQLSGSGLSGRYSVTLNSGFSFAVTAQSSISAVSEEIALGWPDSLAFDTPFTIQSIVSTNTDSSIDLDSTLTFTTPSKQDPLSLCVDGERGETSRFCGESTRPCSSVEVAWAIVAQLGVRTPTIGIVDSTTLGSPIRISNGTVALLSSFGNVDPTLRIPSSACEQVESGLIVVSSSTLEILDVEIVIDSLSPSFVLLSAQNSNLKLKEGSFVGPQSTPSSNVELSEDICSWTSGIVQLNNCTTSISDTKLKHLFFGAVNMKAGSLTLGTCSFYDNSPNLSSFPSLHRNVHCSDEGHLEIEGLNGGDGTGDDPSAWIVGEGCNLTGKESITKASFFVPSLIPKSCNSSYTAKTKTFLITLVGTTLIPCGLSLDVFEMSKEGKEGQRRSFELNLNSTTSFSEKEIVLSLSESSLPTFSKSLEWRGRLVFGYDVHSADSFLIQPNSSDRFSQAIRDNMKWWIPLVVVLSVLLLVLVAILFVCIRRKQRKGGEETKQPLAEMEAQIEVKVDEDGFGSMVGEGSTKPIRALATGMDQSFGPPTKEGQAMTRELDADVTEMGVTVIGTGDGVGETRTLQKFETLYDRLHTTNREVNKKAMMESIVRGLQNAARINSTSQLFESLTSRWILIDSNERSWLQLRTPSIQMTGEDQNTLQNQTSIVSKAREDAEESKRWSAPETANEDTNIDVKKVLVFRLGLVLWEIETGQVPFRELDAVNAQRQIGTGILPRMETIKNSKLVDLLTHCLSFQPNERPSLDDVGKELVEVFGDEKENPIPKNAIDAHVKIEQ